MSYVAVSVLVAASVLHSSHYYSRDVEGRVEGGLWRRGLLCVWVDSGQHRFCWAGPLRLLARYPLLLIHLELPRGDGSRDLCWHG